jgi:hypothetical protein
MATNPTNPTPAAAAPEAPAEAPQTPARTPAARKPAARRATAAKKTSGATPGTKAKAARTTARKPRSRKLAARRTTPGATAARPSLGRPVTRPVAVAPEPEAPTVEVTGGTAPFGGSLLDAVEAAGSRVADYHEQIAEATPLPWVANVARANAEFTRIVTRAYVSGGRTLLRP